MRLRKICLTGLILVCYISLTAAWWNPDYSYRKPVNLTEQASQDLVNHQVRVNLDTSSLISNGKMRSDCGDLRFVNSSDTGKLDYWIESGCDTGSTTVWIEVPDLPAGDEKQIYLYYGNSDASSESDGKATFPVFDGFNDGSLSGQWTDYTSGDSLTESGGRLEITDGNIHSASEEVSQPGSVVEARLKYTSSIDGDHSGIMIADSGSMSGGNSNGNANILLISDDTSGTVSTWSGTGKTTSYDICSGVTAFTASQGENYIYSITDTGSGIKSFIDYQEKLSCTGDLTSLHSNFVIGLGHFSLSSNPSTTDTSYDWVRTRSYVSNPPSVEIGSETRSSICTSRGPENECIIDENRNVSGRDFDIETVLDVRKNALIESRSSESRITVSNRSLLSGTWMGSFNISSTQLTIESGAEFRPEERIILDDRN